MDLFVNKTTFKDLTAPGYFDFSDNQNEGTGKIIAWFDSVTELIKSQVLLFDSFFRLWKTHDYSTSTISRTPYVLYLMKQYGVQWFLGSDNQAVKLLGLVSRSYSSKLVTNFQYLFAALADTPFNWINGFTQISVGIKVPAIFAENLVIFSNSVSLPSTPSPTTYTARDWTAPSGWTLQPNSSTYVSHGYLSGGNIVWMSPVSTGLFYTYYFVADMTALAALSPSLADMAIVYNDGTTDVGSVYYYDGAVWRKTTTPNANQGLLVDGIQPDPQARAVFGNETDLSSSQQPEVSGPSEGYGTYGGMFPEIISSNLITFNLDFTTEGSQNLNVVVYLLRKLKPSLKRIILNYTINGSSPGQIEIYDSGAHL